MDVYARPESLGEALRFLAEASATVAAGCTDLLPATQAPALRGRVLDITAIPGLRGISGHGAGFRIGATATWSDILAADLPPAFDMLKQAAREVGSVQIQNAGTVAGNLCNASPAADGVPCLLALDASVEIASASGTRSLPLAKFITGVRRTALAAGELVTGIVVPKSAAAGTSRFLKLGARRYLVISIAMVAVRLGIREGRIADAALAVGACGPMARRMPALEAALVGRPADAALAHLVTPALVAPELAPIDDIRADAGYRLTAAAELLRRALTDLAGGSKAERAA